MHFLGDQEPLFNDIQSIDSQWGLFFGCNSDPSCMFDTFFYSNMHIPLIIAIVKERAQTKKQKPNQNLSQQGTPVKFGGRHSS